MPHTNDQLILDTGRLALLFVAINTQRGPRHFATIVYYTWVSSALILVQSKYSAE